MFQRVVKQEGRQKITRKLENWQLLKGVQIQSEKTFRFRDKGIKNKTEQTIKYLYNFFLTRITFEMKSYLLASVIFLGEKIFIRDHFDFQTFGITHKVSNTKLDLNLYGTYHIPSLYIL